MDFTLLYRNSNDKQCVHVEQCEILESKRPPKGGLISALSLISAKFIIISYQ